jgi:hypothetical protein
MADPNIETCAELTAFRIAVESLEEGVLQSPTFARANYFRNLFPTGEFVMNQGTTRSNFTIKPSAPTDDQTLWTTVAIDAVSSGITDPGCAETYENIGVNFFERTYTPKQRQFRGPVICKEHFQYQHSIDDFINGYIYQIRQWIALVWELGLRGDVLKLGDWFVDGVKTVGPNAATTAATAYQGLTQDLLETMAIDRINIGVVQGTENGDYVVNGNAGPIYPLYVNMQESQNILKNNPHVRDDARWASAGQQGSGDFGLWQALGTTRTIGNFRHIATNIEPRFNYTSSGYVTVTPFKDITAVGTDQEILTTAYKNAPYGAAIEAVPSGMTIEAVRPQTAGLNYDMYNYNGEVEFIVGGWRICDPAVYDPRGEKGRHFAKIIYAPAPKFPHNMGSQIYKRCAQAVDQIFCS